MENQDEGKVIGNFRAASTTFLSMILLALLPLVIDKDKKDSIEHLRVASPLFAGGVSYVLSIFFALFVNYIDLKRYKAYIDGLEQEQSTLDVVVDNDRIAEIKVDKARFRKKISDINAKSLFV